MRSSAWVALCVAATLFGAGCDDHPLAATPPTPKSEPIPPVAAAPSALDACVAKWLEGRSLNQYGDPPGTAYPGGTPLFDERTGERKSKAQYLFANHVEAKAACAGADGG